MMRLQRRAMGTLMLLAALMLIAGMAIGLDSRGASAQDDNAESPHPAHVHTGACPTPGDVVFPLSDVSEAGSMDGTPMTGSTVGSEDAIPVESSVTTIQSSLQDLVSSPHAIVVHESAEKIQNYISCGDIGGMMMGSDLAIGLGALNDSEESGVAWLHDNGDGTTEVAIFLTYTETEGDMDMGTPKATTGDATSASAAAVEIKNFAFNAATITVPVGTTVTWTNDDSTAHTVSQVGGGFESGKLDPGKTFSYTFDTAGSYDYFCQFHPNMKGTVVVQ
jgi:plastocyanin